jgi:hypothetical protein
MASSTIRSLLRGRVPWLNRFLILEPSSKQEDKSYLPVFDDAVDPLPGGGMPYGVVGVRVFQKEPKRKVN